MDRLKYISTERYMEGIVVEVTDVAITIDLKGRLGRLKVPRRMIITQYDVKIGHEVGFMMSYPEVLGNKINKEYAENIKRCLEQRIRRR